MACWSRQTIRERERASSESTERGNAEPDEPAEHQSPAANAVSQAAGERLQQRHDDEVGGDQPGRSANAGLEVPENARESDRDHRGVERSEHRGEPNGQQHEALGTQLTSFGGAEETGLAAVEGGAEVTKGRANDTRRGIGCYGGEVTTMPTAPMPDVNEVNYDLLIRNGTIYDGSGDAGFVGDVGIVGDTISYVGPKAEGRAARASTRRGGRSHQASSTY